MALALCHLNARKSSDAVIAAITDNGYRGHWAIGVCEAPNSIQLLCDAFGGKIKCFSNRETSIISDDEWELASQPEGFHVIAIRKKVGCKMIGIIEFHWRYWSDKEGELFGMIDNIMMNTLQGHDTILMGDANTEHPLWSLNPPRNNTSMLLDLMAKFKLKSIIEPNEENWTFKKGEKKCWIDIILTSQLRIAKKIEVVNSEGSDHRRIDATLELNTGTETIGIGGCDWERVSGMFANCPSQQIPPTTLPLNKDWFTQEYRELIANLSNVLYECSLDKKGRSCSKMDVLLKKRRRLRGKIRRMKMNEKNIPLLLAWSREIDGINASVKQLGRNKAAAFNKEITNGTAEPWKVCEQILGKEWTKLKADQYIKDAKSQDEDRMKFMALFKGVHREGSPTLKLNNIPPFSEKEWVTICKRVGQKRCLFAKFLDSKGMAIMMRNSARTRFFFEMCLKHGYAPIECISSKIQLIDKSDGKKVRPIAIQNPFSRAIDACGLTLLERYKIPEMPKQFGYIKGKSVDEMFLRWADIIERTKCRPRSFCLMWNFDYSNAFEDFRWEEAIEALRDYGVPDGLINLLSTVLKYRTSFVEESGSVKMRGHRTGSFQGGFISPLLFILATKNLVIDSANGVKLFTLKFADDIIIITEPISLKGSLAKYKRIKRDLTANILAKLKKLSGPIGLVLNESKTKCITLTNINKIRLAFQNGALKKEELKFMGVKLESGIFPKNFSFIHERLQLIDALFRRKSLQLSLVPPKALGIIYDSLVNSVIRFFSCFCLRFNRDKFTAVCVKLAQTLCNMRATPLIFNMMRTLGPQECMLNHFLKKCYKYGAEGEFITSLGIKHLVEISDVEERRIYVTTRDFLQRVKNLHKFKGWHIKLYGARFVRKLGQRYMIETYMVEGEPLRALNPDPNKFYDWVIEDRYVLRNEARRTLGLDVRARKEENAGEWCMSVFIDMLEEESDAYSIHTLAIPLIWLPAFRRVRYNLRNCIARRKGLWFIIPTQILFSKDKAPSGCPIDLALEEYHPTMNYLHQDITRHLNHWTTQKYHWRDVLIMGGAWHKMIQGRRRCRCGGELSSQHLLNKCLMVQQYKSTWLSNLSRKNLPTQVLIGMADSEEKLHELLKITKIALRFNQIDTRRWIDPRDEFDRLTEEVAKNYGCKKLRDAGKQP